MKRLDYRLLVLTFVVGILCVTTLTVYSYGQSHGKVSGKTAGPTIEILTYGRESLVRGGNKSLFYRLNTDGSFEFESRNSSGLKRKIGRLDSDKVKAINGIISDQEFQAIEPIYDSIFSLKDEVYFIDVSVSFKGSVKRFRVKNYMPSHPDAAKLYPASLIRFLDLIQKIRPTTKFEKNMNLSLELPY